MPDPDHPTRSLLLDTALSLADHKALRSVAIDEIVQSAGVAKGTFYVHFRDRDEFLVALYLRFHNQIVAAIFQGIANLAPGAERLRRRCEIYLDACINAAGVKSMINSARAEPGLAHQIDLSNAELVTACAADLRVMAAPHPMESARLLVAAAAEVVRAELAAGDRQPLLRNALWALFGLDPA